MSDGNVTGSASTASFATTSFFLDGQAGSHYLDYNNFTNTPTIPSDTGDLTNNAGFVTSGIVVGYATESYVNNLVAISTFSGDYGDLTNTPTALSSFSNDVGFVTPGGTVALSQGLTGTPNITVGSVIASSGQFNGSVTIGGTLTYEDVTSVDSIGVVTARSGVQIGPLSGIAATLSTSGNANFSGIVTASSFVKISGTSTEFLKADGSVDSNSYLVSLNDGNIVSVSSTKTSTNQDSIDTFAIATYRSATYDIQITRGSIYHTTTLKVLHDGTDVYLTEYATLKTGESLATFNADISGENVRILATPTSATSTTFKLVKTLIEV